MKDIRRSRLSLSPTIRPNVKAGSVDSESIVLTILAALGVIGMIALGVVKSIRPYRDYIVFGFFGICALVGIVIQRWPFALLATSALVTEAVVMVLRER